MWLPMLLYCSCMIKTVVLCLCKSIIRSVHSTLQHWWNWLIFIVGFSLIIIIVCKVFDIIYLALLHYTFWLAAIICTLFLIFHIHLSMIHVRIWIWSLQFLNDSWTRALTIYWYYQGLQFGRKYIGVTLFVAIKEFRIICLLLDWIRVFRFIFKCIIALCNIILLPFLLVCIGKNSFKALWT